MIVVLFSCRGCGIKGARVLVRNRRRDEKPKPWLNTVQAEVSKFHRNVSPNCKATTFGLAIPAPAKPDDPIGTTSLPVPDTMQGEVRDWLNEQGTEQCQQPHGESAPGSQSMKSQTQDGSGEPYREKEHEQGEN